MMLRKATVMLLLLSVFFTLVLNTAGAPIIQAPVSNMFTEGDEFPPPDDYEFWGAFARAAGKFLLNAAAGFLGNAAYNAANNAGKGKGSPPQPKPPGASVDVLAKVAFDY
jgi:hypothetical protein